MAEDLRAAYLLTGSDRPKIERALRRLRAHFVEDAVELLRAREVSGEEVVAACNALGLFAAGGRLVLVHDVERWKQADVKAVVAYLAAPAPDTVLALVGDEVRKDSPLARACVKAGEVLVYEVAKRDLPRWVSDQFARHGIVADGGACRALVELVGDDLRELAVEVDKLATWAGGGPVGEGDIEQLVTPRADVPPFALTDAWGRRDPAGVLSACESILERSAPPTREVLALVGRLAAHVRRVAACRALDVEGVHPREAAAGLKMHPYAAEKAFAQSRNFSTDELREAVIRLAELDLALKGGGRLPAELELQRVLVAITRRPEPAEAALRSG